MLPVERRAGVPGLREGSVPLRLPDAVVRGPVVEATSDAVLFRIPNVGRFLVHGEGPALVERAYGATDADLGCFADEPVAAAAALLRGNVVLHAASVSVGGRAVALCGPSALGKSALAAALVQRGHAGLADAVTAISAEPETGVPIVAPLAPEPVLWPDIAEELGLDGGQGRRVRPALAKRAHRLGPEPVASPLVAVVVLGEDPTLDRARLEPMVGAAKLQALLRARWHRRLVDPLGLDHAQFPVLTRIAAGVVCAGLLRPPSGAPATVLADNVEELLP